MQTRLRAGMLCASLVLVAPGRLAAADWKPVDPAELALKVAKVQPDADAEAIFWEVRVADEVHLGLAGVGGLSTVYDHYIRIKIFTERGRDAYATVEIPYFTGTDVNDVEARTIRVDGSIVELRKADIYKRTVVKTEGFRIRIVSFAVPGIEPGAVIEYRWRERHRDSLANYLRLPLSRELPVQIVRYYIRPLSLPGLVMHYMPFNATPTAPERQRDGYSMLSLANVPAQRDEPYATPTYERRPWLFIFYGTWERSSDTDFWQGFARQLHAEYARRAKPDDDIRRLAAEAVTSAPSTEQKIIALVKAARQRLRRIDVDTASAEERRRARANRDAAEALDRGVGVGDDMVVLFLALATAAGLDARVAAAPDRSDLFHRPTHRHGYFVRHRLAAVRDGEGWTFVDPANEHAIDGALRWNLESQEVLIADPGRVVSARTPLSPAVRSAQRRTGTFTLSEDGTLDGDCRLESAGHWNDLLKEEDDQDSPADRENSIRDVIRERVPAAEVTSVKVENVTEAGKNYTVSYHLRIPGFAQRTGARLIFQPAVFQKNTRAVFSADRRTSELYFPFPWTELDDVTIRFPDGFELEQPEAPADVAANVGRYELTLGVADGRRTLVLARRFTFGVNGAIHFPSSAYAPLKAFFDRVHSRDAHSLILRRKEGSQ